MGISLNIHKIAHLYAARLTDTPYVVTCQVEEHHMFRTLFRVFLEFLRETLVGLFIDATRACSGNRANSYFVVLVAYQQLRRGSYHMEIVQIEEKHVR